MSIVSADQGTRWGDVGLIFAVDTRNILFTCERDAHSSFGENYVRRMRRENDAILSPGDLMVQSYGPDGIPNEILVLMDTFRDKFVSRGETHPEQKGIRLLGWWITFEGRRLYLQAKKNEKTMSETSLPVNEDVFIENNTTTEKIKLNHMLETVDGFLKYLGQAVLVPSSSLEHLSN